MDISTWSDAEILQLPDNVFGARKYICSYAYSYNAALTWKISVLAFPQRSLIWGVYYKPRYTTYTESYIRLAYGAALPTTEAQMTALTPVIANMGYNDATRIKILSYLANALFFWPLRELVETAGKYLITEAQSATGQINIAEVGVLYSEVPTEIQQWLL